MGAHRLSGLQDARRPGRPRRITAPERCTVIALACTQPEQSGLVGYTTWSGSLLAEALVGSGRVQAISARPVQRILRNTSLKPHRCDYWKRRIDPNFDAKMRPVVELYLNPPSDGPVWCLDEKTSIQVLQGRFPVLPLRYPGELIRREAEYLRHGTLCLTADLEVHTGQVLGSVTSNRPAAVFTAFLDRLDAHRSPGTGHPRGGRQPQHPLGSLGARVAGGPSRPRHLPLPARLLQLAQSDMWFRTLVRQPLQHRDFHSASDLEAQIYAFIATYNRLHAHPYR